MEQKTDLDLERLTAYLTGEGSPDGEAQLRQWIGADPERAEIVRALRGAYAMTQERPRARPSFADSVARAGRAYAETTLAETPASRPQIGRLSGQASPPRFGWPALRATLFGASAVILVALGTFVYRSARAPEAERRYQTALGQQATVQLPGGSTVTLAPATSVVMHQDNITVTGQAYFTIVPNPSRPVIVRTANAVVQVLGTRFVVRQYANERSSRVVVEEGRVAVSARSRAGAAATPSVIAARMLAQVTDSGVTVSSGIATRDYTSWRQGMLVFNRTALRDIVAELGRAYGTDIRITDSALAAKTMIIEVSVPQQPLAQVLDFVSLAMDAHYRHDGHTYLLEPGRDTSVTPRRQQNIDRSPQPETQYGR